MTVVALAGTACGQSQDAVSKNLSGVKAQNALEFGTISTRQYAPEATFSSRAAISLL